VSENDRVSENREWGGYSSVENKGKDESKNERVRMTE